VQKPALTPDRRTNHLTRKFVAEMSQKAAQSISETIGLPNRHAFDEGKVSPFVALSEVNNVNPTNERFGCSAGEMLMRRFAEVLASVGLEAYHNLGSTILCKGESYQELSLKLSEAQRILRQQPFPVRESDGRVHTIEGAGCCFGIGTTLEEAELALKDQKETRAPEKAKGVCQKI
jgi:hypothetical protein